VLRKLIGDNERKGNEIYREGNTGLKSSIEITMQRKRKGE
jgi:hypothetical protein